MDDKSVCSRCGGEFDPGEMFCDLCEECEEDELNDSWYEDYPKPPEGEGESDG